MEKLKQRFSKQSVIDNVVNDRIQDEQESILADDSDAFRPRDDSESRRDMTLCLKLSESDNICEENQETASIDNSCKITVLVLTVTAQSLPLMAM